MSSPLSLQFGSGVVTIACEDPASRQTLTHHLQFCTGEAGTTVAHFQIKRREGRWSLYCNETILLQAGHPSALLEPLLQEALVQLITPEKNHLIFHAGGVSSGDRGILLCGTSAVGKSVLTAQLTAAGFDYLSDEVIALGLGDREMSGFSRSIALKRGTEFLWTDRSVHDGLLHLPGGTTWLAPTFFRENCIRDTAVPQLILFPQYNSEHDFEAQSLSPAEAGFHLMQLLVNARNLPGKGFTAVIELARQTPAFIVRHRGGRAVADWLDEQLNR